MAALRHTLPASAFERGRFAEAVAIFTEMSLSDAFEEFLTLPAYRALD
jgi:malate synthase